MLKLRSEEIVNESLANLSSLIAVLILASKDNPSFLWSFPCSLLENWIAISNK